MRKCSLCFISAPCTHIATPHVLPQEEASAAAQAAHLVWYLSRSESLREWLGATGCVPLLVALLSSNDAGAARAAAYALTNLAMDECCR